MIHTILFVYLITTKYDIRFIGNIAAIFIHSITIVHSLILIFTEPIVCRGVQGHIYKSKCHCRSLNSKENMENRGSKRENISVCSDYSLYNALWLACMQYNLTGIMVEGVFPGSCENKHIKGLQLTVFWRSDIISLILDDGIKSR